MADRDNFLSGILAHKREEVAARKQRVAEATLREQVAGAEAPRGFMRALKQQIKAGNPAVITEIKRASPSRGLIRSDFNPAAHAQSYEQHGAACLSVLTDEKFFQGCDDDLRAARAACALPALRKDFTVDPYQIWEARALGADCILLIVAALDIDQLRDYSTLAAELKMDVLVEEHTKAELDVALTLKAAMIGINNRDLTTFKTDLNTTLTLSQHISRD